jgi:FkbM family methyltransferase
MRALWSCLKYFPPGLLTWIKQHSSARLRLWIRETFGGSYTGIPDRIQSIPDGRRFHIGPDLIYWPIYTGVGFEPEATHVLRRLLRAGDVSVDVGANFGWYTTLFAQLCPQGRVYAYEPVPETFRRLVETLALNEMSGKVTAVQAAVSDAAGTCSIFTFEKSSAYSSLSSLGEFGEKSHRAVEVPKISLDQHLSDQGVSHVDFLKCDTEGSELMVLQGARGFLGSPGAPMIFIELNEPAFRAFGYGRNDVWQILRSHGYDRFYEIVSAYGLRQLLTPQSFGLVGCALCVKGNTVVDRLAGTDIEIQ